MRPSLAELLAAERAEAVLFLPVALGVGIGLWFLLPWNGQRQAALAAALGLAALGLALPPMVRRLGVAAGLAVALGLGAAEFRSADVAGPRLHHRLTEAPVAGTVLAVEPARGGERATLILLRDAGGVDPPARFRLSVPAPLPPGVAPGARISVRATLGPLAGPALPGANDPARRGWFQGLAGSGRALAPPHVLAPADGGDSALARLRLRLGGAIAESLGGDAGAIAVALTVGEQGLIRPELLQAMRLAGLAHILTVSGFHIAIVVGGVFFLLRRVLALWQWLALRTSVSRIAAIGAGLAGTGYALLSGADLPAIRAAIAAWVVLLALMLGRDPVSLRLIAFAATLILLAAPESLLDPGFQLSFAAVAGLAALARSPLGRRLSPRAGEGPLARLGRLAATLFVTGLVVELLLTPIALFHFGKAGAYGLVANLLAIPLTSFVVMPLLGLWLLLAPMGAGGLAAPALVLALEALAGIGWRVAAWPGASLALPAIPLPAALLLLAGLLPVLLLHTRLRWLGLPLVAAGWLAALLLPRPDLLVSPDGRQVAVVHQGQLHLLRGHREGFLVRSWAEQAAAAPAARMSALPGARCTAAGCSVPLAGGQRLLALADGAVPGPLLAAACARADLVTAPMALPHCRPRHLLLDARALARTGAVAIHSRTGRVETVARHAGDQPWGPAALPGTRPRLLGGTEWTGVIAE